MNQINWKIRLQNKVFLASLFSLLLLLANQVAAIFGADISIYNEQVTALSSTVLAILSLIGIISDPTTPNLSDSERAMKYGKSLEEIEKITAKKKGQ